MNRTSRRDGTVNTSKLIVSSFFVFFEVFGSKTGLRRTQEVVTPLRSTNLNKHRPISVIPVIAKVFERIVYNQLYAYLTKHNVICKCQSGIRSIHSTVTALLGATDTWAYNIDRGKINAVVFLDLKKAFVTVNHEILLSKAQFKRRTFHAPNQII